jgi:hypothetical protein
VAQSIIFALGTHILFFNRVAFRSSFPVERVLEGESSDQPDTIQPNRTRVDKISGCVESKEASLADVPQQFSDFLPGFIGIDSSNSTAINSYLDTISTVNCRNIPEINFFENRSDTSQDDRAAACLINLDDTIKMAEWLPYHYTVVPLGSLVIALDPKTSAKGIRRTLQLIDLWKDKIDITLWPGFVLPDDKRKRRKIPYIRERQTYFAKQCLIHHKRHNRGWTLLTDNDEYLLFNYINSDEKPSIYHVKDKNKRKAIDADRKKNMPLRNELPPLTNSTIVDFLRRQSDSRCIRLPYINYGGGKPGRTFAHSEIIPVEMLSTIRDVHHEQRHGRASKVMIDLSKVHMIDLEKGGGRTIHNPNSLVCGKNGAADSGTDYMAAMLRMNHYIGSMESFFERQGDYRRRDSRSYQQRSAAVNASVANFDLDIVPWVDALVAKVGKVQARELLAPLSQYIQEERQLQMIDD